MMSAPVPVNEAERLADLYQYELLDTPYEKEFNDIVRLASKICNTPISSITLIDINRQWHKATVGLNAREADRRISFCAHAICQDDFMEINDTLNDERFSDNPLVSEDPSIRYYAGVPLVSINGYKLGTLCVIDTIPRNLDDEQAFALKVLAAQVMTLIELRLRNKQLTHLTATQNRIISIMAHDVRNPLTSLKTMIDLEKLEVITGDETVKLMPILGRQVEYTINMVKNLVDWGKLQLNMDSLGINPVTLKVLINKCTHQLDISFRLKQNKIINLVSESLIVNTDENALEFIVRNLLSNANKFTDAGTITISCEQTDGQTYIMVKDTGTGIKSDQIPILLNNVLNYSSKGTRQEEGSGMGLILIKELLDKLNGHITITSQPGDGTCITISL